MTAGSGRRVEDGELRILNDIREMIYMVYKINFPVSELYGLQSQIRRAAVSVSLNIVEGNVFRGAKKCQFFEIALASCCEVEECLKLSRRIYFSQESYAEILEDTLDKIRRTIRSLLAAHRPSSEQ